MLTTTMTLSVRIPPDLREEIDRLARAKLRAFAGFGKPRTAEVTIELLRDGLKYRAAATKAKAKAKGKGARRG